jgi:hypothetical protein
MRAHSLALLVCFAACEGRFGAPAASRLGPQADLAPAPVVSQSLARRLTQHELDNTLADLLGDDTRAATRLLTPDSAQPFDNDYTLQIVSQALIDAAELMAEQVSQATLADPARRAKIVPCTPSDNGDSECFASFVQSFGKRALRRPLTDAEVAAYSTLLGYATEQNPDVPHDFYTAVDLAVQSILQDPEFLYRVEKNPALDDYEIGARLSYLLWGSAPDDALLAAADNGELTAPDGRRAQAERMLKDPRARRQLGRFHAMWLGYTSVPATQDVADAFQLETQTLIERVVFDEQRDYFDLFRMPETFWNQTLASHYGADAADPPAPPSGWVPYKDPQRAGILAHGAVLSAFGKFSDTSPTQRGIFIRSRLLCQTIAPPPPNVKVDQAPGAGTAAVCKVDRYAQHRQSASCSACHSQLDPIGFGLEQFDLGGKRRAHDDGHPECPIDGQGNLPDGTAFSGPKELSQLLLDGGALQPCVVEQIYRFAVGRPLGSDEARAAEKYWLPAWQAKGFRMDALLVDLIASNEFGQREEPQ